MSNDRKETLHIAFSVVAGQACVMAKDNAGGVWARHSETLQCSPADYWWRTLWLACLLVIPHQPETAIFYTDGEEVVDLLKQFQVSEVKTTPSGRRKYSSVPGLDKKHNAYFYIRSIVPMLNEFWSGRWQIASVPATRLSETKALAIKGG